MSKKIRLKKGKCPGGGQSAKARESLGQNGGLARTIQTGLSYHQAGNFLRAQEYYLQVLAIDPAHPTANTLLATLYYQSGNSGAALPLLERALQAKPDYADALNLLGNIHHGAGQHERAIACYRQALHYQPGHTQAHNNLGIALEATGQYQAALDCYGKLLALHPGYAEAHANRAIACKMLGRLDEAIISSTRALTLRPDFPEARRNFAELLRLRRIFPPGAGTAMERKTILDNCLNSRDLEPQIFFPACLNELFQGDIAAASQRFLAADVATACRDVVESGPLQRLCREPLCHLMLTKTLVTDRFAELFLTRLRKVLTITLAGNGADERFYERMTPMVGALAQQCYWNEFVFHVTDLEEGLIADLAGQLRTAPASARATICLALLACYGPLSSSQIGENRADDAPSTAPALAELLRIHLVEPQRERELAAEIGSLAAITDGVSRLVQQQYEENPYPRWTGIALPRPRPFMEQLRLDISPHAPADLPIIAGPEVLVAGCGTGRQPLGYAACYENATVVALDLSRASLAYAKRKAAELGVANIDFIQGDLLELGRLGRTFDVIACIGVLHHLRDPRQGLRVLVDQLRPAGYMKIALYSELARQHVVAAREFVLEQGFAPTAEGIRACRQALFALPDAAPAKLVTIGQDFFATSTVRDLIFHVQEHRFTLPEIAQLLEECHLEFLGFAGGEEMKRGYLAEHGDDPAATSLDSWACYERNHPETFFEMYNFWVRKGRAVAT